MVEGAAEVTRGDEIVLVHEKEPVYLSIGTIHRMTNPGKINLALIEVQTGSCVGEDDIIRTEDVYNRAKSANSAQGNKRRLKLQI